MEKKNQLYESLDHEKQYFLPFFQIPRSSQTVQQYSSPHPPPHLFFQTSVTVLYTPDLTLLMGQGRAPLKSQLLVIIFPVLLLLPPSSQELTYHLPCDNAPLKCISTILPHSTRIRNNFSQKGTLKRNSSYIFLFKNGCKCLNKTIFKNFYLHYATFRHKIPFIVNIILPRFHKFHDNAETGIALVHLGLHKHCPNQSDVPRNS